MSADEMFEKLGYKKREPNSNFIVYIDLLDIKEITFYKSAMKFEVLAKNEPTWVDLQELAAINKKVEELRLEQRGEIEMDIAEYKIFIDDDEISLKDFIETVNTPRHDTWQLSIYKIDIENKRIDFGWY